MATIREHVTNGKYDPGTLPVAPRRPIPVFCKGQEFPGSEDYRAYARALEIYEQALREYQALLEKYSSAQQTLLEEFARDIAIEHNMIGHPKQDVLYQMAWKHAHHHTKGLLAVITWYEEFLPLAR